MYYTPGYRLHIRRGRKTGPAVWFCRITWNGQPGMQIAAPSQPAALEWGCEWIKRIGAREIGPGDQEGSG